MTEETGIGTEDMMITGEIEIVIGEIKEGMREIEEMTETGVMIGRGEMIEIGEMTETGVTEIALEEAIMNPDLRMSLGLQSK